MSEPYEVDRSAEEAELNPSGNGLKDLRVWVSEKVEQDKEMIKPLNMQCHCGEDCGAWYNLS